MSVEWVCSRPPKALNTVPDPAVYAPLPVLVSKVNCVAFTTVTVHVPFAAVFPKTPEITTCCPVERLWSLSVVI